MAASTPLRLTRSHRNITTSTCPYLASHHNHPYRHLHLHISSHSNKHRPMESPPTSKPPNLLHPPATPSSPASPTRPLSAPSSATTGTTSAPSCSACSPRSSYTRSVRQSCRATSHSILASREAPGECGTVARICPSTSPPS